MVEQEGLLNMLLYQSIKLLVAQDLSVKTTLPHSLDLALFELSKTCVKVLVFL